MEPKEANMLKPTCVLTAQSNIAVPKAPPCEIKAISPGSGLFPKKVALIPAWGLTNPRQLGPSIRIPCLAWNWFISSSNLSPSSPTSLNPAEIITAPSTPLWPHSSTISGTVLAWVAITAKSICSGTSVMVEKHFSPKTFSLFGLTAYTFLTSLPQRRFFVNWSPMEPSRSVAPINATLFGLSRFSIRYISSLTTLFIKLNLDTYVLISQLTYSFQITKRSD